MPTLDHVVVNVHDRMDEAQVLYGRLGFTLTPRGYHSLGSVNHLAIFGTDYLELIGAPAGGGGRRDILGWPVGLNGLVWGTEDSAAAAAALAAAGVEASPPNEFTRPVELPGGPRDAVFRTVRLPNETTAAGRLYFCHHLTRDLVWRDEWRRHANGTVGVLESVIAAEEPARLAGLFARMFGAAAVRPVAGGSRLTVGLSRFDVVDPRELTARFGAAAAPALGRREWMAALVLRTQGVDMAEAALRAGGIVVAARTADRVLVGSEQTMGVTLAFVG
ncbi:MAG: VOC family protein [Acetobacteraceae bacterium]|nr:VOC family protein [Acetobacteraceae bacterium]